MFPLLELSNIYIFLYIYYIQKEKQILLNNYKTEADYLIFAENKKRNIPYGMSEIDQNFYILSKDTCLT